MTARTLRGLTRRLTKYHSQIANWHYKDEALELASAEIGWLHDEARKRQRKMTPQCTNRVTDISSRTVSRLLIPMVKRRITRHEPIAYIIGNQPFGPLDIEVRAPVLIPRPETEEWALVMADRLRQALQTKTPKFPLRFNILDMCTGSGCVGLTLAHIIASCTLPGQDSTAQVTCADIATYSISMVQKNIRRNRLDRSPKIVQTAQVDIFSNDDMKRLTNLHGSTTRFDVIVCNPPYIPASEYLNLEPSVREWEDRAALIGEVREGHTTINHSPAPRSDGLAFYRRLGEVIPRLLAESWDVETSSHLPSVVVEVGKGQAARVEDILLQTMASAQPGTTQSPFFSRAEVWDDAWSNGRAVALYRGCQAQK